MTENGVQEYHEMAVRLYDTCSSAEPTPFHRMLDKIASQGRLQRLYTQNIDGLDVALPSLSTEIPLDLDNPPRTIQLHGTIRKMRCDKCSDVTDFKRELFVDESASPPSYAMQSPHCSKCSKRGVGKRFSGFGPLRPAIQLYGEPTRETDTFGILIEQDDQSEVDLVIVVGTSLAVKGTKELVKRICSKAGGAEDAERHRIWINPDLPPKEFEGYFDTIVRVEADEVAEAWRQESGIWTSSNCEPYKGLVWPSSDDESEGEEEGYDDYFIEPNATMHEGNS